MELLKKFLADLAAKDWRNAALDGLDLGKEIIANFWPVPSIMVGHGDNVEDCIAHLQSIAVTHDGGCETMGAGALPWATILQLLMQILPWILKQPPV